MTLTRIQQGTATVTTGPVIRTQQGTGTDTGIQQFTRIVSGYSKVLGVLIG